MKVLVRIEVNNLQGVWTSYYFHYHFVLCQMWGLQLFYPGQQGRHPNCNL